MYGAWWADMFKNEIITSAMSSWSGQELSQNQEKKPLSDLALFKLPSADFPLEIFVKSFPSFHSILLDFDSRSPESVRYNDYD